MIVYCTKTFNSFVDFEKIIGNFELQIIPFGTIDIIDSTIKDPSIIPRYEIKFRFDCQASDAIRCENYLQGHLINLLGEFY